MLLFMDCSGVQGSEGAARPMLPSGQPANAVVLEPQPLLSKPGSQQVECKACSCLSILTRQKASWPYLSAPMIRKRKTRVMKIVHLCLPKSPPGQVCGRPGLETTAVAGTTCHLWSAAGTTTTKHGLPCPNPTGRTRASWSWSQAGWRALLCSTSCYLHGARLKRQESL